MARIGGRMARLIVDGKDMSQFFTTVDVLPTKGAQLMAANPLSDLSSVAVQIARFKTAITDATRDRDALIVAALDQGYSEREVSTAAGLSNVRVHQIKENNR